MFVMFSSPDTHSADYVAATLAFLTSPALLVPEQRAVTADDLEFVDVGANDYADKAWTWQLSADAPRIGDVADDPPQNYGVVAYYARLGGYIVTVDSGAHESATALLATSTPST